MLSTLRKHHFGIILACAALAIAGLFVFLNWRAILVDKTDTQIDREIDIAIENNKQEEKDNEDSLLIKCKNLHNLREKYKTHEFKFSGHKDSFNELNDKIRELLNDYYEQLYKGFDTSNIENDLKDVFKKNVKERENKYNEIQKKIKNINIDKIQKAKIQLETLLAKKEETKDSKVAPEEGSETVKSDSTSELSEKEQKENEEQDFEWQRDIIENSDVTFSDFKDTFTKICELYSKFNELGGTLVDNNFIEKVNNAKNFKEALTLIVEKKDINQATEDVVKEKLGKFLNKLKTKDILKALDGIDNLNNAFAANIKGKIKLDSLDNKTVSDFLVKYKLQKDFLETICENLKNKIEDKYINPEKFNNQSFDELNEISKLVVKAGDQKNPELKTLSLYKFAADYINWYNKSNNENINFNIENITAHTDFDKGIRIDNFKIEGYDTQIKFNKKNEFSTDKSFKIDTFKDSFELSTLNLNFKQSLVISISYSLGDATPNLKNGYLNFGIVHTNNTISVTIYPMLRSKWSIDDKLESNNKKYKTSFKIEIKNADNRDTLEELFYKSFPK